MCVVCTLRDKYQCLMDLPVAPTHHGLVKSPPKTGPTKKPLVAVVDDDESVRESLPDLLREFGFAARSFSSAEQFLASDEMSQAGCLVLDVVMPGMTGLELNKELKVRGQKTPVIFITAQKDEDLRERALKQGAVELLIKPFSDTALLAALRSVFPGS
jgi:FixJ family two-component response regulator